MNIKEAEAVIDTIDNKYNYVYFWKEKNPETEIPHITLDGSFTADQLEAIATKQRHLGKQIKTPEEDHY